MRDKLQLAMINNMTLEGEILSLDKDKEQIGIYSSYLGEVVYMPYNEYGNSNAKFIRSELLIGEKIKFNIMSFNKNIILVSSRDYAQNKIKELQNIEVEIIYLFPVKFGGMFKIKGEPIVGLLKDNQYTNKTVSIRDILKINETVNAEISYIGNNNKVDFSAISYNNPIPVRKFKDEDFVRGKVFNGTVVTISGSKIFVNVDLDLDVLSYIPDKLKYKKISRGQRVIVKVLKATHNPLRVRGVIVGVLN